MTDGGQSLELLLSRLAASDEATRGFIRAEISAATAHDRRMDVHEVVQRYIAQGISFVLPGAGLWIAYALGENGQETAAAIIGGLDIVGIISAMWIGIRRRT